MSWGPQKTWCKKVSRRIIYRSPPSHLPTKRQQVSRRRPPEGVSLTSIIRPWSSLSMCHDMQLSCDQNELDCAERGNVSILRGTEKNPQVSSDTLVSFYSFIFFTLIEKKKGDNDNYIDRSFSLLGLLIAGNEFNGLEAT